MPALVVAAAASAWLLLGAGLMKIRHPESTQEAIRTLVGFRGPRWQSRLLGAGEVIVGGAFVLVPGPISAATLGFAYGLTFGSAFALKRRDVDCGCFGADSSRIGPSHLVITASAAVVAFALTFAFEPYPGLSVYVLVASAIPIALSCYALIAPMTSLRSDLAQLNA